MTTSNTNNNSTPTYTILAWGASISGKIVTTSSKVEEVIEIARSLSGVGQTSQIVNLSWGHSYVVTWGEDVGGGASAKGFGEFIPKDVSYLLKTLNR